MTPIFPIDFWFQYESFPMIYLQGKEVNVEINKLIEIKSKDCGLASQGVLEFQSHESCRLIVHEVLD